MKVQETHLSQPIPNHGEAIPIPTQAHLVPVQKAEPLWCLALRTRTGIRCAREKEKHTHMKGPTFSCDWAFV